MTLQDSSTFTEGSHSHDVERLKKNGEVRDIAFVYGDGANCFMIMVIIPMELAYLLHVCIVVNCAAIGDACRPVAEIVWSGSLSIVAATEEKPCQQSLLLV